MTESSMAPADVLAVCRTVGIRLSVADGDMLEIDAPQGTLTPELLARMRDAKEELLTMLRAGRSVNVNTTPSKPEGSGVSLTLTPDTITRDGNDTPPTWHAPWLPLRSSGPGRRRTSACC